MTLLMRIRQMLHLAPDDEAREETKTLIDETCAAVDQVRHERTLLRRELVRRPDLAEALLLARDRRTD